MRDHDAAESPLASYEADPVLTCDSVRDILQEPFRSYAGALPQTHAHFRVLVGHLLEVGLKSAEQLEDSPLDLRAPQDVLATVVRLLQLISRDTDRHYALRATCYLRLLRIEGRSFAAIGAEFGVCRAAVQAIYGRLQKRHPELKGRGDKSDAAREACRLRRLGARKQYEPWLAASLWRKPLDLWPTPLLLSN